MRVYKECHNEISQRGLMWSSNVNMGWVLQQYQAGRTENWGLGEWANWKELNKCGAKERAVL